MSIGSLNSLTPEQQLAASQIRPSTGPQIITNYSTYTSPQPLIPMPATVYNNPNLGWNYATGKVVQPLPQSQIPQIPAYAPQIKTPQQTIFATQPRPTVPATVTTAKPKTVAPATKTVAPATKTVAPMRAPAPAPKIKR